MPDTILVFGREPRKKTGYATVLHVHSMTCVWRFHPEVSNSFLQITSADIDVCKIKGTSSVLYLTDEFLRSRGIKNKKGIFLL